jgi:ABC-type transport system substrate-binding protein
MHKKSVTLALAILALTMLIVMPSRAFGQALANPPTNQYELVCDIMPGDAPTSVDPASSEWRSVIHNVYEGLIIFYGESPYVFQPLLATQVWIAPPDPASPPYTNYTIYFKIRTGVPFHNWSRTDEPFSWAQYYLTTEDVQYSIQRFMVHEYPIAFAAPYIFKPLLDCYTANMSDPTFGTKIENSVQRNGTHVWLNIANPNLAPATGSVSFTPVKLFATEDGRMSGTFWNDVANLPLGYPLRIILQLMSTQFFSVMSKQWILNFVIPYGVAHVIDLNPDVPGIQFEWDGNFSDWSDYHGWGEIPLDMIGTIHPGVTCGTGPYILDRWDPTTGGEYSLVKFDSYWGGWPASYPSPPYAPEPSSGIKLAGYVTRITFRQRTVESIRVSEFVSGGCDLVPGLDASNYGLLHVSGDVKGPTLPGIRVEFYPALSVESFHFTFLTEPTLDNKYGKVNANDTLSEDAIPANFFNDTHVRKAFAYLINYTAIIHDRLLDEAYQPVTCASSGLPYVNPAQPTYYQNITKAVEEFSAAFGGRLGTTGFTVNIVYYVYYISEFEAESLAATINKVGTDYFGGKFHAVTQQITSADFFAAMAAHQLPAWPMGWTVDYADIDNFIGVYMSSGGSYSASGCYDNPEADALIAEGIRTPDGPARQAIYYRLEEIYYEDCPSVCVFTPILRMYDRTWLQGQQPPQQPFYFALFGYRCWKWEYLNGNVNYDNKVDMADIVAILDSFGAYYGKGGILIIHPKWNFNCDVDGNPAPGWRDRKVDMYDVTQACDNFGKTQAVWTPP